MNETFDLDDSDNQDESSHEMTDVSPLPSPHDSKSAKRSQNHKRNHKRSNGNVSDEEKFDMSVFYKALNNDFGKKLDSVFTKISRTSSANNLNTRSYDNFENYGGATLFKKVPFDKLERAIASGQAVKTIPDRPVR
jgi:hypothetical protein